MSNKYKMIDLFAGCGGLEDGFLQSGKYEDVAAVEWLKPQVNTLIKRLETKWKVKDAKERVMHFDIQREKELFEGWQDDEFGQGKGLDYFVNKVGGIDIIIGGPPCQAYSVAGRVRDENGIFLSSQKGKITRHCQRNIKEYISIMRLLRDIIVRNHQIQLIRVIDHTFIINGTEYQRLEKVQDYRVSQMTLFFMEISHSNIVKLEMLYLRCWGKLWQRS